MDRRGRVDEEAYMKDYQSVYKAKKGISSYFSFMIMKGLIFSLPYKTRGEIYFSCRGII